jgi:hypothetical protein
LKNTGENPSEVKIYQTDHLFFADGKNLFGEPGSIARSNARWITVSPKRLTVPPKDTVSVYYTVQVPKNPDLKGSYWSMVMVEPIAEGSPESVKEEEGKVKVGLQTVIRYGIQIVTDIGSTGERNLRFQGKRLISEDGKKALELDIENTGERWISPLVWVELYSQEGKNIGRFESNRQRIYPGCSVGHKIDLSGVPGGKYKALVVADNKDDYVVGGQYDLQIE